MKAISIPLRAMNPIFGKFRIPPNKLVALKPRSSKNRSRSVKTEEITERICGVAFRKPILLKKGYGQLASLFMINPKKGESDFGFLHCLAFSEHEHADDCDGNYDRGHTCDEGIQQRRIVDVYLWLSLFCLLRRWANSNEG